MRALEPAQTGEEPMRSHLTTAMAGAAALAFGLAPAIAAPLMIVDNDEKVLWDDAGKVVLSPPGKDSVLIVDLADPMNPKIVANLPLKNSVVGPPSTSTSIRLARSRWSPISMNVIKEGDALKQVPDDKLYEAAVFAPDGNYVLVGNYIDQDFSILKLDGTEITDTGKRFKVPGHPASAQMGH